MKKLLLFVFLCVSAVCMGQVQPKTSTTLAYGYLDVRSFGAVGDSSTDNTAAFRACFAEAGRLHTKVIIPSGNWVVNDSIIVQANVAVEGIGGGSFNDANSISSAATTILVRSSTHNLFVTSVNTNKSGIKFTGLSIINQSGSIPTAGSAIVLNDGGDDLIRDCTFSGFFIDVNVVNSIFYTFDNCHFNNPVKYGISLGNTNTSDQGDFSIQNCKFTSAGVFTHPTAGLYWHGTGGMKVSDCKFVFTSLDTSKTFTYDVLINNIDGSPSDIMISNCSMESFDSMAIKCLFPGPFRHFNLNNIQTETSTIAKCAAIQILYQSPGALAGQITIDNINSMSYNVLSSASAIQIVNADQVYVGSVVYANYTKPYTLTNCNGFYALMPPSNNLPELDINSDGGIVITADRGVANNGPDFIDFFQGTGTRRMRLDGQGRWLIGAGTPFSSAPGRFILGEYRKDTATQISLAVSNTSTNANASVTLQLNVSGASSFIQMLGPNYAGYKNFTASGMGFYAANGAMAFLTDNGSGISFNNTNQHGIWIHGTNPAVGFDNATPDALLTVAGSTNINIASNGTLGNLIHVGNSIVQNISTGVGGTVAHYAVTGFGANPLYASNTGVTYTNASTMYIAGAPTAGTNVTIAIPWALFINSGNVGVGTNYVYDATNFVQTITSAATTNTVFPAYVAQNLGTSTSGQGQYGPAYYSIGSSFASGSGTSQEGGVRWYNRAAGIFAAHTNALVFESNINGGAYTEIGEIRDLGGGGAVAEGFYTPYNMIADVNVQGGTAVQVGLGSNVKFTANTSLLNNAIVWNYAPHATTYTVGVSEHIIETTAAITANLPAATLFGQEYTFVHTGTGTTTITANGTELIYNGAVSATTYTLTQGHGVTLVCSGLGPGKWLITSVY